MVRAGAPDKLLTPVSHRRHPLVNHCKARHLLVLQEKQCFFGDMEEKVQGAYLIDLGSHQTGQNEALAARLRARPSARGAS